MKNSGFFNSGDRTSLNANNVNSASRNSLRKTTDSERK